ncbi:MAG: glycosyltransferase family 4 protein [Proteobacteria bacterium]|nr:glycosyltransferase family 4 protein [Pseudomonadota bacterium]
MRLAFLLYKYFPYGGMQRDFKRFVEEVQLRGHHCRVYYISWQGEHLAAVDQRQVPVKALSNSRRNARYYDWVKADLVADPVDGVIGFNKMPGLDVYYAADSCYMDKAMEERNGLYRLGARYRHFAAYERAVFGSDSKTEILLISETEKAKFQKYYDTPQQRLHMLPPGISVDRRATADAESRRAAKRKSLGLSEGDHVLLFVGSGFIKKGLDRAIRALAALRQSSPGQAVQLYVVGQDKERRFRRLAEKLSVLPFVSFLGGRDDIPDLLLAADVLIHPALDEAAGIVLLEALVAGLPVLVTDVCGYAHHIAAAGAGLVLDSSFSQPALDQAVLNTLDPGFLDVCKKNALSYAEREDLYSMHKTGAALIERFIASGDEPSQVHS